MNIFRSPRPLAALLLLLCTVAAAGCGVSEKPRALPVTPAMPSNVEIRVTGDASSTWAADNPATWSVNWPADWTQDEIDAALFIQNAPIYFYYDSATLTPDAKAVLSQKAGLLRNHPRFTVIIAGHCDERGTDAYNYALGGRRAKAARDYLVSLGLPASRLETTSFGKSNPQAPGKNENAWSQNRRADFIIKR